MNERELSLKIRDYLNKHTVDFKFKFIDDFCDIADEHHKVFIEVKSDHFASAQLLHAIARKGIRDVKFLGVADNRVVKLYLPPDFEKIYSFATSFDPKLVFAPSQVDKPELNEQANIILGKPDREVKLEFSTTEYFYITQDNVRSIKPMIYKYRIDLDHLVNWLDGVGETDAIKVNPEGWLVNTTRAEMFTNESEDEKKKKELTEFGGSRKPKYIAIKQHDISFFESLRVRHENLADILHEIDRFMSRKKRREHGVFWTEEEIGDKLANEILELARPEFVVEPCVGGGSLIRNIVPHVKGAMNDISKNHIENCKKIFDGYDWKFTSFDVVKTYTQDLIREWGVPSGKKLLLYTNPPFGTSSTNRLVSKKEEMNEATSRKQVIDYPVGLLKYGKGNLFLPIVGRLIETARVHRNCCLAFFSPFSLFCGGTRYSHISGALLKDFKFLRGYVFAGNYFHDINKTLPIALTIWDFAPNTNAHPLDLHFEFVDKHGKNSNVLFKKMPLLKDGWRYRDGNKYVKHKVEGAIGVPRCERFWTPRIKVLCTDIKEGSGAELSPDNLRTNRVLVPSIPSELIYALWSVAVGKHAFGTSLSTSLHPIYFEQAYVHLPDFTRKETIEILAYSALHVLVKNYAENQIGFFGTNKVFRFDGENYTKSIRYLINMCKDCPVYEGHDIAEVFDFIRQSKVDVTKCRKGIKEEVSKRLEEIGYWDYVPIP